MVGVLPPYFVGPLGELDRDGSASVTRLLDAHSAWAFSRTVRRAPPDDSRCGGRRERALGAHGRGELVSLSLEGVPDLPDDAALVRWAMVSDDYFSTLRIPLQAGRTFDSRDHPDAPPSVVISESTAHRYWPGGEALGSRVRRGNARDATRATNVSSFVTLSSRGPTFGSSRMSTPRSRRELTFRRDAEFCGPSEEDGERASHDRLRHSRPDAPRSHGETPLAPVDSVSISL